MPNPLFPDRDASFLSFEVLHDYLELLATVVVAWQWLDMASAAQRGTAHAGPSDATFYRGKLQAARYFLRTELPRVAQLAALCESFEDSYDALAPEEL